MQGLQKKPVPQLSFLYYCLHHPGCLEHVSHICLLFYHGTHFQFGKFTYNSAQTEQSYILYTSVDAEWSLCSTSIKFNWIDLLHQIINLLPSFLSFQNLFFQQVLEDVGSEYLQNMCTLRFQSHTRRKKLFCVCQAQHGVNYWRYNSRTYVSCPGTLIWNIQIFCIFFSLPSITYIM